MKNLICPVSAKRVDSFVSRLTIFLNVILLALFLVTQQPVYACMVALDYSFRATGNGELSPLCLIAGWLARLLNFPSKMVQAAPKIFASRLGWICAVVASVLSMLGYATPATAVAGLLAGLAFMDAVFNVCMGCLIYHYVVFPVWGAR